MQTKLAKTTAIITMLVLVSVLGVSLLVLGSCSQSAEAQQNTKPNTEELRAGKNFIPTKAYTAEEDEKILKLFEDLRVADVSDGMDKVGLTNVGLMSPEIHALWKDTQHFTHRFIGIAVTVRYVPTNKPPAPAMETEAFDRWVSQWYKNISS